MRKATGRKPMCVSPGVMDVKRLERQAARLRRLQGKITAKDRALLHRGIWSRFDIDALCRVLAKIERSCTEPPAYHVVPHQKDKSVFVRVFEDAAFTGEPIIILPFESHEFNLRTVRGLGEHVGRESLLSDYVIIWNNGKATMYLAWEALADVIRHHGVASLDLSHLGGYDNTLHGLSSVLCYGPLQHLDLRDATWDEAAYHTLCNALQAPRTCLETLKLNRCEINDELLAELMAAMRNNTALKTLDLQENDIHDEGVQHVADMLQENQTLQNLYLDGNEAMTGTALDALTQSLRYNRTLKLLHFEVRGPVDDLAGRRFTDMLRDHCTLTSLLFHWHPAPIKKTMQDAMVEALQHNHTLLDFSFCSSNDDVDCGPVLRRNCSAFLYLHSLQRAAAMKMHQHANRWRKPRDGMAEGRLRRLHQWKKTSRWKEEDMTPAITAILQETEAYKQYSFMLAHD